MRQLRYLTIFNNLPTIVFIKLNIIIFSFFPNVLQPPIAVFGNTLYGFFVRIGICRKTARKFDISTAPLGITINMPGIDPHDMERRR